ncbi:hypothetical protein [Stutzerimonas xanthomarina]|uniref:hypothetical protein n=1 Tax=Stutzerimonas xanthomarina TaxID=271420 RepID=UPI003AA8E9AC
MIASEIMLLNYKLLSLHADRCSSESDSYEAHFTIRYSMKEETTFDVIFELFIRTTENSDFFKIKIQGTLSKTSDKKEDTLEGKHAAACMLYPYVRTLAMQVLDPLGHHDLEFPYSVPVAAIKILEAEE